jgi:hypothetical protein
MHTYQIDTSISDRGIITLPEMPDLYNQKVKLIIISTETSAIESKQRKINAMERLLKMQDTMLASHWTDEELDNVKYECLNEKYL